MKKLFSFFAILGIVLASNCSRIPENNNPIIGIWNRIDIKTSETGKQTTRREWIFNDAYLGRFQRIENGIMTVKTDFNWKVDGDDYILKYPGIDRPNDTVSLGILSDHSELIRVDGFMLATRD